MTNRQSLIVALMPTAIVVSFLLGRYTAPTTPAAAPAADIPGAPADQPATFTPTFRQPPAAAAAAADPALAAASAPAGAALAPGVSPQGDAAPDAPLSPTPELDARIASAEKNGDKKAISAAYTERGSTRMYDDRSGRKVKYRAALDDFRKAVAADPTNETAKTAQDTIESIYKSLHRPVPTAGA